MGAPYFVLCLIVSLALLVSKADPAFADSFVGGKIVDAITQQPIAGADVYVEYSSKRIGVGKSNIDGVYRVSFTLPSPIPAVAFATVTASGAGHAANASNLQITDGSSDAAVNLELYPSGLLECRSQSEHSVIIGNFLPPSPAGALSDLSRRIAKSLEFALRIRLQAVHLTLGKQPSFEPCEAAKPATTKFGAKYARALKADAFVDGDVAVALDIRDQPGYSVSFSVSDAYDFFPDPQVVGNRYLNLNAPSRVSVSDETHIAVLASIAVGLAKKNDCVTAIQVISVAERLIEDPNPDAGELRVDYLAQLRKDCEARVPNVNLRKGAQ
jgi:hypothetical protein